MLTKLKNKNKEAKKETKTKKATKQQKPEQFDSEEEQNTDLVDMAELEQGQNKVKQTNRKKNDYQLQEKEIDVTNINLAKTEKKPEVRTTWVANTVDEVMKKDFVMDKIDHEFVSLTDESLNEKLLAKQKEEEEKQKQSKVVEENNIKLQVLEKSADQLKMEKADQEMLFGKGNTPGTSITNGISTTESAAKTFKNSNFTANTSFQPIEKTAQQLRMEEAEAKEQEMAAKKPASTSWFGKKVPEGQKPVFKQSAWAAMAVQNQDVGANLKFAPLQPTTQTKQPKQPTTTQKQPPKKQEDQPKPPQKQGWAASNIIQSNGMKFAPLQQSKQDERMERKEQEFIFVSKKDMEERKKKREEKELQMKAQGQGQEQPKV